MRRAIPVIAATAGGLALLAAFQTDPGRVPLSARSTAETTTAAGSDTIEAPVRSAAPPPRSTSPPVPTGPHDSGAPPTTDATRRSVAGPAVSTRFGLVQVRVVLAGGAIVDVQALALPDSHERSVRISDEAGPILRREALQAQGARIDTVSGATYTSDGYAQSLQGALDRANP